MLVRLFVLIILGCLSSVANANARYMIHFELIQNDIKIESGTAFPSNESQAWSKGLKRSYLKLNCARSEAGKLRKNLSTEDHFAGLDVTHKIHSGKVSLKVVWQTVQPRLDEIRALSKSQCKKMTPVVTTVSETFEFALKSGLKKPRPFGDGMFFRISLQALSSNR